MRHTVLAALLLSACASTRNAEDPSTWYASGDAYDVSEAVLFTDQPYDFSGETAIAELPSPSSFQTIFASDDGLPEGDCTDWGTTSELPTKITGIATMHPRYYYKSSGCRPSDDPTIDSDEKYYGSFFIQDESGGIFVLGDTKVAHFEMGDKVTLDVRAMKESFGLTMIFSQDLVEVERGPFPIAYQDATPPLRSADAGQVRRMTGTIGYTGDFGEIQLCTGTLAEDDLDDVNADDAQATDVRLRCIDEDHGFYVILDSELQRRGVEPEIGEVLEVTGPVLYSFNEYRIVVTRLGQITTVE